LTVAGHGECFASCDAIEDFTATVAEFPDSNLAHSVVCITGETPKASRAFSARVSLLRDHMHETIPFDSTSYEDRLRPDARAAWQFRWVEDLAGDLRYGFRTFQRSPGFAVTAGDSLALGIGADAATFDALYTVPGTKAGCPSVSDRKVFFPASDCISRTWQTRASAGNAEFC
jgi:hypothetical protein